MLNQLSWPTLQKISRLQLFHKILHHRVATLIYINSSTLPTVRQTRQYHPLHFILAIPIVSTTLYQQSEQSKNGTICLHLFLDFFLVYNHFYAFRMSNYIG